MSHKRQPRWYFGGLASVGATTVTHPLDLLKVGKQTGGEMSLTELMTKILHEQGVLAFYNGLSASILRQLTYSTTRFAAYDVGKSFIATDTFMGKFLLAAMSGVMGGIMGTPSDMINVRMQNDVKLPPNKRRNYKCGLSGIIHVYKSEGFAKLFSGGTAATVRGMAMTVGQIAFYDQIKTMMLRSSYFNDNMATHFSASLLAGAIATTLTQPLDVLKTRQMNATPGTYKGVADVVRQTASEGVGAFYKGYTLAFLRLGPHTILTFMLLEQLRLHFGWIATVKPTATNICHSNFQHFKRI